MDQNIGLSSSTYVPRVPSTLVLFLADNGCSGETDDYCMN